MKNKKAFALILIKPVLWLLYILIVSIFLILFTLGGVGSSGRDSSIVSAEMGEFITTLEAINYLRTPVGETTVCDLVIKAIKGKDVFGKMTLDKLETQTKGLVKVEDVNLKENTITISINKPGKKQEIELYLISNLKDNSYFKIIMEIPYDAQ